MTRTGFALALLALALLGLPSASLARAHSPLAVSPEPRLADATPRPGSVLATPPPRLQFVFGGAVDEAQSHVEVWGPTGERADRRDQQVDGDRVSISLLDQGPGLYRVHWRSAGAERPERGHALSNVVVGLRPPAGTRRLWGEASQPDHADEPKVDDGQVVWPGRALPAHAVLGPSTFSVSAAGRPPRTELHTSA